MIKRKRDNGGKFKGSSHNSDTWSTYAEVEHVKQLGLGIHSPGSDLRHKQSWWLKKYLEATVNIEGKHIQAGRRQAQLMLSGMK